MEIRHEVLCSPKLSREEKVLILADLHQDPQPDSLPLWQSLRPTQIWIPGDFLEDGARYQERHREETLALLSALARLCPVYLSLGNHETGEYGRHAPRGCVPTSEGENRFRSLIRTLEACQVTVLHNRAVKRGDLWIGGLTSGAGRMLSLDWLPLPGGEEEGQFRVLLCHHPEYYDAYLRPYALDLVVSGHAHGGQWRFFGRGVYAPGQGLFPRYTDGFYCENKLLVTRGLCPPRRLPRWGNPLQTMVLHLIPGEGSTKKG